MSASTTQYNRAKTWQIGLFTLNNVATNTALFLMGYYAYFSQNILGLAAVVVGGIATAMRVFDGVTDGLLEYVDILLAQNVGSKAFCLQELLKKGYDRDKALMVGDAPGDLDAAKQNGVFYFPILVRCEVTSWTKFRDVAVDKLVRGEYGGVYQQAKIDEFWSNLR